MAGALKLLVTLIVVTAAVGGQWVAEAQLHHVVGDDHGWDQSSDVESWSSGRIFRVGDKLWFTYSAAQEKIVELKSKEEFEACDVSNPIRMYTDGLHSVPLEHEGIRYFASGKPESCKNGLKLHVDVQPQSEPADSAHNRLRVASSKEAGVVAADGPTTPSGSAHLSGLSSAFFVGMFLCFLGL
ncbi:hypothetical protein NMG60_11022535 [Bertholletia excelsa]